jgi:RHS repeat-associated protein
VKRKNLLIILLALAFHAAGLETAKATCSMSPTANITTTPAALVFYTGESVQLSGATSIANCGSINEYRWRVRPVGGSYTTLYQGSSSTWNHTFTLASGVSEQRYDVELRVRNSVGLYNTRTIQVTVTRNNKSLYYLTDHLGSVRVTVNERGDPVGWDDYYPFGLQMPERNQNASNAHDDQKFTGYELEQQGDLGLYHAGARMYDPEIGRFLIMDPLMVLYPGQTPYHYTLNNPVNYTDPTGEYVVKGTNVRRTPRRWARTTAVGELLPGVNFAIAGGRDGTGDPSHKNTGMTYASLITGGIMTTGRYAFKSLQGVSKSDMRILNTGANSTNSGVSTIGLIDSFVDPENLQNIIRDEVMFDLAHLLETSGGSQLGYTSGIHFHLFDSVVSAMGGEEPANIALNDIFERYERVANQIITERNLDLTNDSDRRTFERNLRRTIRSMDWDWEDNN